LPICCAAELARSSFCYELKALGAADKHSELSEDPRDLQGHKGRHGCRRFTAELRQ